MRRLISFFLLAMALLPSLAFAQLSTDSTGLHVTGEAVYQEPPADIGTYLGERIITPFFGVLGIIFLILVLYGGIQWMMAGGNDISVTKAKSTIVRALLGLIIILLSYGLTQFVFQALTDSPTP
jgi:uncharacterized membrane protein YwzB